MDLLTLNPIHKIPGEHMDCLLEETENSRTIYGKIIWNRTLAFRANAVLCAAAISLFSSNDPDDESAILTLSRLWQAI